MSVSTEQLIEWGVANLNSVIAIDSQSDEDSKSMPSTEGQKRLSEQLAQFFTELGWEVNSDPYANLMVRIPPHPDHTDAPTIALMVHLDTSKGTEAIPQLLETPAWDGETHIAYSENKKLRVSTEVYPETRAFVGDDLLHGTGRAPVGLDNKLGMCQLMALAQALAAQPDTPRGEIYLVFRPDEEIGRMEVLESLADTLKTKGVTYGYTIDGLDPFEVNVENFNAARGRVTLQGKPLSLQPVAVTRRVVVKISGVKSHGATAKAEGYRNATILFSQVMDYLGRSQVAVPIDFQSNPNSEVDAEVTFLLRGRNDADLYDHQTDLLKVWESYIRPHRLRGADFDIKETGPYEGPEEITDECYRLADQIKVFLNTEGVAPILSEESEGYEGYSNPYFVGRKDSQTLTLDYRLRAFTPEELKQRAQHLRDVCEKTSCPVEIEDQYINMGPALKPYPELVEWAEQAAQAIDQKIVRNPIRGGTGVDPFLERNIPIANLGTGYFAPESEKEFTSRQAIGRHIEWLLQLVQVVGKSS